MEESRISLVGVALLGPSMGRVRRSFFLSGGGNFSELSRMLRCASVFLFSGIVLSAEPATGVVFPEHFPAPELGEDFELTTESVLLGKTLFHDNALSVTNTVSCAFCHLPHEAFSDPSLQPWGVRPERSTRRHSMPLFNLAWKKGPFRWDGDEQSLRDQILRPITDPIELGEDLATLPKKLAAVGRYPELFGEAFGDSEITSERMAVAMEHYLFSLISADSKYDQAKKGEVALSEEEERGQFLFFQPIEGEEGVKGAGCATCHPAPLFTDHQFHNNGLRIRRRDRGREEVTGEEADRGKFATPSLRNIEITSSYMHDGRFATLEEVVRHYSSGITKSGSLDPSLAKLPGKGLQLSKEDEAALVAFLKTLTDPIYLEEGTVEVEDPFAKKY